MATKKRHIVVVKNIKESTSPKKQLLVARKPVAGDDFDSMEPSVFGSSPSVRDLHAY